MYAFRTRTTTAVLVLALACGGGGDGSPTSPSPNPGSPGTPGAPVTPAANEIIATTSNTFTPSTLTVSRGTTVTFTFQATQHNVMFANVAGAPAGIPTTSSTSVQRTFSTAGTFGYDCSLHSGMTGTVIVN
jgi:plastocyanin